MPRSIVALCGEIGLGGELAWASAEAMCHSVKAVTLTALGLQTRTGAAFHCQALPAGRALVSQAREIQAEGLGSVSAVMRGGATYSGPVIAPELPVNRGQAIHCA